MGLSLFLYDMGTWARLGPAGDILTYMEALGQMTGQRTGPLSPTGCGPSTEPAWGCSIFQKKTDVECTT